MATIYMVIDKDGELTGLTCTELAMNQYVPDYYCGLTPSPCFHFTANNVVYDESQNLISLPDELLLRIRDHNIDAERKNAIKQTLGLKDKIESLKDQVRGWELRRDLIMEEWKRYEKKIDNIIDKYPRVAAEIALEDGDLDAACYFAAEANEEN